VRRVKRDEQEFVQQRFADALLINSNRDLWSVVKRINGWKAMPVGLWMGFRRQKAHPHFFAKKYHDLYSGVPYDLWIYNISAIF